MIPILLPTDDEAAVLTKYDSPKGTEVSRSLLMVGTKSLKSFSVALSKLKPCGITNLAGTQS